MSITNYKHKKQIASFSFLSASSAWATVLIVFPIDKINIRVKVNTQKNNTPIKIIKNLIHNEGFRGLYRGISLTPFTLLPTFFCSGMIYQYLNLHWKNHQQLNKSYLFHVSPVINIFLAGLFTNLINTPNYMLSTIIHSQKISIREGFNRICQKNFHSFFQIYKVSYFSISVFVSVRQMLYEHLIKIFRVKYKFSQKKSIILTTVLAASIANLIYQPFEVIMARLAVCKNNTINPINILRDLTKQTGLVKGLYRGFSFRLMSSGLFNVIYLPIYGMLKHEFDLNTYI